LRQFHSKALESRAKFAKLAAPIGHPQIETLGAIAAAAFGTATVRAGLAHVEARFAAH
jgi:hypothetical protein